jgi:CheY-like chemotaxis protein
VSFGIIASHGGHLRHEDGPGGKGTTFIVELPVSPDVAESRPSSTGPAGVAGKAPAPPPVTVPAAATPTEPATVRILVLDDDDSIRDFLVRILRRNGYDAVAAADGASALEIIRRDPPRAILCDYRMAGMSGIAFHEAVAALDPGLARRFAFMSGDVLNAELHDFAVARGILVVAKPFDIEGVGRAAAQIAAS